MLMPATLEGDFVMFGIQVSVRSLRLALGRELRAHAHACLESQIQKTITECVFSLLGSDL